MVSDFVRQQLALAAIYDRDGEGTPSSDRGPSASTAAVLARRSEQEAAVEPSSGITSQIRKIATRQAIGDEPKAANDNKTKPVALPKVRKSSGKFVRGAFAESLPMVMALRNMPDHAPEPITSTWSIDAGATIPEPDIDESGKPLDPPEEDMLLEITPSISKIRREFENGAIVRGAPQKNEKTGKIAKIGPVIQIGKLHFSNGKKTEKAIRRREGKAEAFDRVMPLGAMLQTEEKLSPHIGQDPTVTMSNRRLTEMLMGKDAEGNPKNWRPFTPKGETRKGKSLTPGQSRELIARAMANTPNMPTVTICPPGVASGAARFSDQFYGVVKGTNGKGGAVQWVSVFEASRNHAEWQQTVRSLDPQTAAVLTAAMTAKTLGEVGVAAGQSASYAAKSGGRRVLVAANDNLAAAVIRRAA